MSETCDVYAFGSNSSSQLAMGSTEKFVKATLMSHMANCQLVNSLLPFLACMEVCVPLPISVSMSSV